MLLTDATVRSLKPGRKQYDTADEVVQGLKLRVSPKGARSFSFMYRTKVKGNWKTRRISIGPYPSVSLSDARKEARKLRVAVDKGRDPWSEQLSEERVALEAPTLSELFVVYDEHKEGTCADSTRAKRRITWRKHGEPFLGGRPAHEVSRGEVKERVDAVANQAGAGAAANLKEVISCIYNWALDNDHIVKGIDKNPATRVKTPKLKKRKRYLGLDELSVVWHGCLATEPKPRAEVRALAKGSTYTPACRRKMKDGELENRWRQAMALRLLIATGLRPIEVRCAKQDAFHVGERRWLIDAADHKMGEKTGEPHFVWLNDLALEVVSALLESMGPHEYLIPNLDTGKPFGAKVLLHFIETRQYAWQLPRFTPYDLRRTFASQLAAHRANRAYVDLCQARKIGGVQFDHYNWYSYQAEKAETWGLWSTILSNAIASDVTADGT